MEDLEYLLLNEENYFSKEMAKNKPSPRHTADKNANLFDLVKMVNKLVMLTMKKYKLEFVTNESKILKIDPMEPLNNSYVTYRVLSRKPKDAKKPTYRETLENENGELYEVWGQKFKCQVMFSLITDNNEKSEEILSEFENMMFKYTGFFKKNGIGEIYYENETNDDKYTLLKETLYIRNIIYYVEIEKLTVIFKETIKEVIVLAQNELEKNK